MAYSSVIVVNSKGRALVVPVVEEPPVRSITRDTIDTLLDHGMIEARMHQPKGERVARWWTIRRNGKTWRGRRDKSQIRIPVKAGLNVYDKITERDFLSDGTLDNYKYRIKGTEV